MELSVPDRTSLTLIEALDGQFGSGGVRELALNPMQHGLADLLNQCLPGHDQLIRTELLRTKYKPGRKLTAYYRLHVGAVIRPIALSWAAQPQADSMAADIEDSGAHRQLVAPFARLAARTPTGQTVLHIAPWDPQMPQLMRLNERSYVLTMLNSLSSAPALRPDLSIEAVRYRPGQRHVLHVSAADDRERGGTFIKIDRDDCGARAVQFARAVGPRLADRCPTASLVPPLGYSVEDRAAIWGHVAGTLMSQEVRLRARSVPLLSLLGKAIRVLHDLAPDSALDDLPADRIPPPHPARAELASTLRAGEHLTALVPAVGARYRLLAAEVVQRLDNLPAEEPRLSHGDLKCDNILAAGDRICLLDLDRSGLADPAMDLGKLLADLAWWGHHHGADAAPLIRGFLEGYGSCDPARLVRARLIAVLFQLKLAARRTPVHSADWGAQVTRHVDDAAATLGEKLAS